MNTNQHSEKTVRMNHLGSEERHQHWISTEKGFIVYSNLGTGQIQFRCGHNNATEVVFRIQPASQEDIYVISWSVEGSKIIYAKTWEGETVSFSQDILKKPTLSLQDGSLETWCDYLSDNKILTEDGIDAVRYHLELYMRQYALPSNS